MYNTWSRMCLTVSKPENTQETHLSWPVTPTLSLLFLLQLTCPGNGLHSSLICISIGSDGDPTISVRCNTFYSNLPSLKLFFNTMSSPSLFGYCISNCIIHLICKKLEYYLICKPNLAFAPPTVMKTLKSCTCDYILM